MFTDNLAGAVLNEGGVLYVRVTWPFGLLYDKTLVTHTFHWEVQGGRGVFVNLKGDPQTMVADPQVVDVQW